MIRKSDPFDLEDGIFYMIGIYKITSPSNKIYIGQALDIEKRWATYRGLHCKMQTRLYNSFKKYGVDNHIFEIVCQCNIENLNEMERFYQDLFCSTNSNGLNCRLTKTNDRSGKLSDETRKKMSEFQKGKIVSDLTRAKFSAIHKGKTVSIETRDKIRNSKKGKITSAETRAKISKSNIGRKISKENIEKISASRRKIVLHLETGVFFDSAKIAANTFNFNYNYFMCMLTGINKNKTNCIYI